MEDHIKKVDTWLDKLYKRQDVDFSELSADFDLPPGFIIASLAHYEGQKSPFGRDLGYLFSVQLLNKETSRMPRGTGNTVHEAVENAIKAV